MNLRLSGLVLLLLCAQGRAQEALDWAACVRAALAGNPGLIAAREQVAQAEAERISARSGLLPQVNGNASATKRGDGTDGESYSYGVSAGQLLFDRGKTRAEARQAEARLTAAQLALQAASAQVRLDLRSAFVDLLRAEQQVSITRAILDRRQQHTRLVRLRYEAGREHKGSLLTAEAKEAEAQFEAGRAERAATRAAVTLGQVIGALAEAGTPPAPLRVQGRLDVAPETAPGETAPDFAVLAADNPELLQRIAERQAAAMALKSAAAERWPSLAANAQADARDDSETGGEDSWSVGVRLSVPLFEGRRLSAQVARARAGLRRAEADEQGERDRIVEILSARWTDWRDAVERVEVRRRFLSAAQERATISAAQYSSGMLAFDNWIIIEDEFAQAEKALVETQAAALGAEAYWVNARGGTLEDEIE